MAIKEYGNITSDAEIDSLRIERADDSTKFADLEVSANHNLLVKEADNVIVQGNDTHTFIAVQNTSNQVDSAVTSPTSGLTLGVNGATGYILNRYAGELIIGTTNQEAIRIATDEDATFVANLSANGSVTLGDASDDTHTVNGVMTFANGLNVDTINDASGDAAITIDATANLTFSNNVTVNGTMNMPTIINMPNTGDGTIGTDDAAADANGSAITISSGSAAAGGTDDTGSGGDLTLQPGAGKGTEAGGDLIIQTAPAGSTGSTINNYTTQMVITGEGNTGFGGTTSPDRKVEIVDSAAPQLRLTHTDATHYADAQVASDGALTVTNSGGAIKLDSAGDVELDSGSTNATMKLLAAGTEKASIDSTSDDISLTVATADKDFKIKGTDDSTPVTAITIDFSEAGRAIFNNDIRLGGNAIEDSGGNDVLTFDGSGNISNDVVITGSLAFKPKTIVDTGSSGTTLTVAQSGSTVILTDDAGFATLPNATSSTVGIAYVVVSGANVTDVAVKLAGSSSDNFYSSTDTGGTTSDQTIEAFKSKTFVCSAENKWIVIG